MENIPEFEYDPLKSASNLAKHGIDFESAKAIWKDERRLEFDTESTTEQRFGLTGMIGELLWTAFATIREGNVRIISVRRARIKEIRSYEEESN